MSTGPRKRVLIKLSGEAFCVPGGSGFDPERIKTITAEIQQAVSNGAQIGIMVGAGNLVRGRDFIDIISIHSVTADYMGMLGTTMNGLALKDTLMASGIDTVLVNALDMPRVCEGYYRPDVLRYLDEGKVVIFAGGTSHPGVTTDMCAAIRAYEVDAEILLKATKVDGVYDSDPEKNPDAVKYDRISYEQAIAEKLGVMDIPALAYCMEKKIPIMVFNLSDVGNLVAAVNGENPGTLVDE